MRQDHTPGSCAGIMRRDHAPGSCADVTPVLVRTYYAFVGVMPNVNTGVYESGGSVGRRLENAEFLQLLVDIKDYCSLIVIEPLI